MPESIADPVPSMPAAAALEPAQGGDAAPVEQQSFSWRSVLTRLLWMYIIYNFFFGGGGLPCKIIACHVVDIDVTFRKED